MKKADAEQWLVRVAESVQDALAVGDTLGGEHQHDTFKGIPYIDAIIADVKLGDWNAGANAALNVLKQTDADGNNATFRDLLGYYDCPDDDDRFWGAHHTIECCVGLAPWLITHKDLAEMAHHTNFSVRSAAAVICMDLAHSAPDRVPIDILLKLSTYSEDWYVETPANSALKAMARSSPFVLEVFFERLKSSIPEERAHAASSIADIANTEPELLDPRRVSRAIKYLEQVSDEDAANTLVNALPKIKAASRAERYRYGL